MATNSLNTETQRPPALDFRAHRPSAHLVETERPTDLPAGDYHPVRREAGAAPAAEIVGWIEPWDGETPWRVTLRVHRAGSLLLAMTDASGLTADFLATGTFDVGDYELAWPGGNPSRAPYLLTLVADDYLQTETVLDPAG